MKNKLLLFKTRDEILQVKLSDIAFFSAERTYTTLHLTGGQSFIFSMNLGIMEKILEKQLSESSPILQRVGKSHIINRLYILHLNIPRQKVKLGPFGSSVVDLHISKEALRTLKQSIEIKYNAPPLE